MEELNKNLNEDGKEVNDFQNESDESSLNSDEVDNSLNDNNQSEELEEKIKSLNDELGEVKDKYMRTLAEFDNFRKRSLKEKNECFDNATAQSVKVFLEVLDNLERALDSFDEKNELKNGVELILNQFKSAFNSLGVKEIEAIGQKFNPSLHEAVSTVENEKYGHNEICEVFRKGYIYKDIVLRHTMVCVANA